MSNRFLLLPTLVPISVVQHHKRHFSLFSCLPSGELVLIPRRFLRPIGDQRWQRLNISTEKLRKRGSKRKRSVENTVSETYTKITFPSVLDFVKIGHNMTTRHLESWAQKSEQTLIHSQTAPDLGTSLCATASSGPDLHKPLVAVFVSCAEQPPIIRSHIPYLIRQRHHLYHPYRDYPTKRSGSSTK